MKADEELPEDRQRRLFQERRDALAARPVDVVLAAHWTVSALWASLTTHRTELAPKVIAAHHRAVDAAVADLNKEAAYGQVGARWLPAETGLSVDVVHHEWGAAENADPHLHTHLVIDQHLTVNDRGRPVRARLDPGALKRTHQAAGALYELILFGTLMRSLGVDVGRDDTNRRILTGIPDNLHGSFQRTACRLSDVSVTLIATDF